MVNGIEDDPMNIPGAFCCCMVPVPYRDKMESLESCFFVDSSDFVVCSVNRSRSPDAADKVAAVGLVEVLCAGGTAAAGKGLEIIGPKISRSSFSAVTAAVPPFVMEASAGPSSPKRSIVGSDDFFWTGFSF